MAKETKQTFHSVKQSVSYTRIDANGKVQASRDIEVVKENDKITKADFSQSLHEFDKDGKEINKKEIKKNLNDLKRLK